MIIDYATFRVWADALEELPTPADIRRHCGCSITTSYKWRDTLVGVRKRLRKAHYAGSYMGDVLRFLDAAEAPLICGQVAAGLGISAAVAAHALQNLYEAGRIERQSHSKPYAYSVPRLNGALRQFMAGQGNGGDLAPSLGVVCPVRAAEWRQAA